MWDQWNQSTKNIMVKPKSTDDKSPAFMVYVKEWADSNHVLMMDDGQLGWYWRLLLKAWRNTPQCTLPDDEKFLQGIAKAQPDIIVLSHEEANTKAEEFTHMTLKFMEERGIETTDIQKLLIERDLRNAIMASLSASTSEHNGIAMASFKIRWSWVMECFVKRDGRLVNERLLRELNAQAERRIKFSTAGKAGAEQTWNGRKRKQKKIVNSDAISDAIQMPSEENGNANGDGIGDGGKMPMALDGVPSSRFLVPELEKESANADEKSSRGSRCKEDFYPNAKSIEHCITFCPDIVWQDQVRRFVGYWVGEATGRAAFKSDWQRTFRNRMDDLQERYRERNNHEPRGADAVAILAAEDAINELAEDNRIIAEHQAGKYKRLDVRRIYNAMNSWCADNDTTPTPDLLINWLDNALADLPLSLLDQLPDVADDGLGPFREE